MAYLYGAAGNDILTGGFEDDWINGGDGDDRLSGGAGDDTLYSLDYSGSRDTLDGGDGHDEAYVDRSGMGVDLSLDLSNGTGNLTGGRFTTVLRNIERLNFLGGWGYDTVTGTAGDDTLDGCYGDDRLGGGAGNDVLHSNSDYEDGLNDTLDGGSGSDYAIINRSNMTAALSLDLSTGTGNLTGGGFATVLRSIERLNFWGGSDHDTVIGTAGDDTLEGGYGNDRLSGGAGNDHLYSRDFEESNDTLDGGNGTDDAYVDRRWMTAAASLDLSSGTGNLTGGGFTTVLRNIERLSLNGGSGNDAVTGAAGDDTLGGGYGNDRLSGGAGNDSLAGNDGNDSLSGGEGYDFLEGHDGNDSLGGGAGNDALSDGAGNDALSGGAGDDSLYSSDTSGSNDMLDGGDGADSVIVSRDSMSAALLLNLFTGTGNLTGGGFTTVLRNIEQLSLWAGSGNDTITGTAGGDLLYGFVGNDSLNGGKGGDTLIGGLGSDTYVTDGGDTITEAASAGTDTVRSSVSYTLGTNLENLVLTGVAALNGTGNALANRLTGNGAANMLNGGTGADTLAGGLGDDTYVTDGGDTITEAASAGTDTVRSSVSYTLGANLENLVLTGAAALTGTGNALANRLTGNGAANMLNGGTGADTLTGGAGHDVFVFNTALSATNVDRITDFVAVDDTIRLENAVFTGLSVGALAAGAFTANMNGVATDVLDRVIYETDTGRLYFDADGTGASQRVLFAVLNTGLAMTAADFLAV